MTDSAFMDSTRLKGTWRHYGDDNKAQKKEKKSSESLQKDLHIMSCIHLQRNQGSKQHCQFSTTTFKCQSVRPSLYFKLTGRLVSQ